MTDSPLNPTPGVVPIVPDPPATDAASIEDLRAALVLQQEADALVAEALETKRSALERAETLVREAEHAAARAEEEAATAAAQRIATAREEADRLLLEAQDQAARITREAHAEVAALRHDAADLRSSAKETVEAAERELERVRSGEAERERQLLATRAEAVRMIEALERVAVTLDDELERVRAEVASARRNLAQLPGDVDTSSVVSPSVVLQWPHQVPAQVADPASTDPDEAMRGSKHRRGDAGSRRGLLRKTRT
ncbi:hypothetical protein [Nocardioides antri]|uniref:Uncharacterized protein n=1 Tax=Nocardioides antri TaxID=2607659 RepID=A0A5B1M248_9ACTN|nr:hypothetical protein [Nocardioides antri]KAA1425830.1 hypothetical protein F0U47_15890 [Nocardioides antri]